MNPKVINSLIVATIFVVIGGTGYSSYKILQSKPSSPTNTRSSNSAANLSPVALGANANVNTALANSNANPANTNLAAPATNTSSQADLKNLDLFASATSATASASSSAYTVKLAVPNLKPGQYGTSIVGPSGTIKPGQKLTKTFVVPEASQLTILTGGKSAIVFKSPDGKTIAPNSTQDPNVNYEIDATLGIGAVSYNHPAGGTWSVTIDGSKLTANDDFMVGAQLPPTADQVHLEALSATSDPQYSFLSKPGDTIYVRVFYVHGQTAVSKINWQVRAQTPKKTTISVPIYDDGQHADGAANDGIFVGALTAEGPDGFYEFEGQGTLLSGAIVDIGGTAEVQATNDLLVDGTVLVQPTSPKVGQAATVSATLKSAGTVDNSQVPVELDIDGTKVTSKNVDFHAGQSQKIQFSWTPSATGSHKVQISISPFSEPYASDFKNNTANTNITVQ